MAKRKKTTEDGKSCQAVVHYSEHHGDWAYKVLVGGDVVEAGPLSGDEALRSLLDRAEIVAYEVELGEPGCPGCRLPGEWDAWIGAKP